MSKHGRPDWYNITPMIQIHASDDVNELAARLHSNNLYDRRGNVICLDDFFTGNAKGTVTDDGLGSTSYLEINQQLSGNPNLALYAIANANAIEIYSHNISITVPNGFGTEWCWNCDNNTIQIQFQIYWFTPTKQYRAAIKFDCTTSKGYYLDSGLNWVQFATNLVFGTGSSTLSTTKLVVDTNANTYLRFIQNNRTFSLAAIPVYSAMNIGGSLVKPAIKLIGNASSVSILEIYWTIITINEL